MIQLTAKQREEIETQVKQHYPNETCGMMAGQIKGDERIIEELYPVTNINTERASDRYVIDPKEFLEVSEKIRRSGRTLVGIYHSHPDHPDRPSEFDRAHAWEIYSYIIVGVQKGSEVTMRSFVGPRSRPRPRPRTRSEASGSPPRVALPSPYSSSLLDTHQGRWREGIRGPSRLLAGS